MRRLDIITDSIDMNFGKLWEEVKDMKAWLPGVHGVRVLDTTWRLKNNNKWLLHILLLEETICPGASSAANGPRSQLVSLFLILKSPALLVDIFEEIYLARN